MDAREIFRKAKGLPTIPAVVARLGALLSDDRAGAVQFVDVVKPDASLTANLLRLANSPFFGARRQITSVRQAITLMGIRRVFELAASASFGQILPSKIPGYEVASSVFWKHCVAVAVLSEALARKVGKTPPEMIFTAGLLHDIGKLAIGSFLLEERNDLISQMDTESESLVDAEERMIGTTHAHVGAIMAEEWNLPEGVALVNRWHHNPDAAAKETDLFMIDLVHLADSLSISIGFGSDEEQLDRPVDPGTQERIGLQTSDLEEVASESLDSINQLSELINQD